MPKRNGSGRKGLRIVIADDHALMRRGLKAIIGSHAGWEVCGEASNGREAVAQVEKLKPDVAILDMSMPECDGLEAARKIREAYPQTKVLIMSVHRSEESVRDVRDAGAKGYIVKTDSDGNVLAALEVLAKRRSFFSSLPSEDMLQVAHKRSYLG